MRGWVGGTVDHCGARVCFFFRMGPRVPNEIPHCRLPTLSQACSLRLLWGIPRVQVLEVGLQVLTPPTTQPRLSFQPPFPTQGNRTKLSRAVDDPTKCEGMGAVRQRKTRQRDAKAAHTTGSVCARRCDRGPQSFNNSASPGEGGGGAGGDLTPPTHRHSDPPPP